jgi:hypothetical protein
MPSRVSWAVAVVVALLATQASAQAHRRQLQDVNQECPSQMQACNNDADCGQILASASGWPDYDTCYANTYCGALYDCAMATMPCPTETQACDQDATCVSLRDADPYDEAACMANSLCSTLMNCYGVYQANVAAGTPVPHTNGNSQKMRLGHYSTNECSEGFATATASGISCRCPYGYQHTTVEDLYSYCTCEKTCTRQ